MKISDYIQHRHNLEQLDINVLNKTDYENEKNDDLKILLKVSKNNHLELPISLGDKYILWFYIFIGFILSIIFSMGYSYEMKHSDKIYNVINITIYVLFVITIPLSIFIGSSLYKIYSKFSKKVKSNLYEKFINDLFIINFFAKQKKYLKEVIKITSFFYFNIVSISYSVFSIIWLLYFTGIKKYAFFWDSTWVSIQIIKGYSTIIEAINFNLIPISLRQESISDSPIFDVIWLWFLIVLTIAWIIIPKILLLIFNKYIVQKKLNDSFIHNSDSQRILKYIKPETSTTNQNIEQMEETNKTNTISQIIKFDLSRNSNFNTVLLWQLSEKTNQNIKNNTLYNSAIALESTLNLNKINLDKLGSILILINIDNAPKLSFINLLAKLDSHDITIKFVNVNGIIINSDNKIDEWLRFIRDKNIKIEEINE